jgi:hypothetical protein
MALYRSLGLTAKAAAMVLAEIVSMITRRQKDDEMLKTLCEKFSGIELVFASYILGRIVGMSYAIKDTNSAITIMADFKRYIQILEEKGKEELQRVVEKEILDETIKEIEKIRDVI